MKRKILLVILLILLIFSSAIFVLNNYYLPLKVKALAIKLIAEQTNKEVSLASVQLNIFKGLVLRDVVIGDKNAEIIRFKEASFTFLIWPFFKKKIIVPQISIIEPYLLLERRKDNSINLLDLFKAKSNQSEGKFNIFINKVIIKKGKVIFVDNTLNAPVKKNIEDIGLALSFSFPSNVKFNLHARINSEKVMELAVLGKYDILKNVLDSKFSLKNFSPQAFKEYLLMQGFSFNKGLVDAAGTVQLNNKIISSSLALNTEDLSISKEEFNISLKGALESKISYDLINKKLLFSGRAKLAQTDIFGLDYIEAIEDISGDFSFDNSKLVSDNLAASCLGFPVKAKLSLTDYANPSLHLNGTFKPEFNFIWEILKTKFSLDWPITKVSGNGLVFFDLKTKLPFVGPPQINGFLDLKEGKIEALKLNGPIDGISGRINFTTNSLNWDDLIFNFSGKKYQFSGLLSDFSSPLLKSSLTSFPLKLISEIRFSRGNILLNSLNAIYNESTVNLKGTLSTLENAKPFVDVNGNARLELNDFPQLFNLSKELTDKLKLGGNFGASFTLKGNPQDLKNCSIKALANADNVSLYGLKLDDVSLDYAQVPKRGEIQFCRINLYGGILDLRGILDFNKESPEFIAKAIINNLDIAKLKLDTQLKKQDISGTLHAEADFSFPFNNFSSINSRGLIVIKDGNLWQLDLFKGMGALLFTTDYTNIKFTEGSCNFRIQNKRFFTDDLILRSMLADIEGSLGIGFDESILAKLNVHVAMEAPLTGTFKDVTTKILGQADRFGIIEISGTLKKPEYKFKPAVPEIIESLKNIFFKKE